MGHMGKKTQQIVAGCDSLLTLRVEERDIRRGRRDRWVRLWGGFFGGGGVLADLRLGRKGNNDLSND